MGSRDALAYLASPEVVAASAIAGKITMPDYLRTTPPQGTNKSTLIASDLLMNCSPGVATHKLTVNKNSSGSASKAQILDQFPKQIQGEIVWCHQDNLNTDGIYAGKHTYVEVAPARQAEVAMENYDPNFGTLARKGIISLRIDV